METRSTRSIPYILGCNKGFTVAELLVTAFLGLLVVGLALSSSMVTRNVFLQDLVRTRLNQNLRGSLDIIGADVRVGGENLGTAFPAVEIINGSGNAPDELLIRRNLIDEVLPLCTAISASSPVNRAFFAIPGNIAGCVYSAQTHNFDTWKAYRQADENDAVEGYIYDTAGKVGEFFTYTTENDSGTSYYIERNPGNFTHDYPTSSTAIYILEEWRYSVQNGMLQLIQNNDTSNPLNVSFGIDDFQVVALMQDGTSKTNFTTADSWTDIESIQITLTGSDQFQGETLTRSLTGKFFPRNVLSN